MGHGGAGRVRFRPPWYARSSVSHTNVGTAPRMDAQGGGSLRAPPTLPMARFGLLIRCVGEAVAAQGLRCLLGLVPFGERLYDIARDAHERYKQRCGLEEGLASLEAAARASLDEVKGEVREAVAEIRANAPPAVAAQ